MTTKAPFHSGMGTFFQGTDTGGVGCVKLLLSVWDPGPPASPDKHVGNPDSSAIPGVLLSVAEGPGDSSRLVQRPGSQGHWQEERSEQRVGRGLLGPVLARGAHSRV